jgi:hypothetical protein
MIRDYFIHIMVQTTYRFINHKAIDIEMMDYYNSIVEYFDKEYFD